MEWVDPLETGCKRLEERGLPEQDIALFSEAMKDVKRLKRDNNRKRVIRYISRVCRSNGLKDRVDIKREMEKTLERGYELEVENLPEYMEGHTEGISPLLMERLRRGEFSIQRTIDLHGYPLRVAEAIFEGFLRDATRRGLNCVKVIHGRGLKSKDAPILKEGLKGWLLKAMHRKWIVAFSSSRMADGGPGATYILLKRRPKRQRLLLIG